MSLLEGFFFPSFSFFGFLLPLYLLSMHRSNGLRHRTSHLTLPPRCTILSDT